MRDVNDLLSYKTYVINFANFSNFVNFKQKELTKFELGNIITTISQLRQ